MTWTAGISKRVAACISRIMPCTTALVLALGTGALSALVLLGATPAPAGAAPAVTPTLYVANLSGNTITSYPLSAGGNIASAVTNSSTALSGPSPMAFDNAGDLWVANYNTNAVVEFTPGQVAAGGSPTPAVTLSGGAIHTPTGLAFDASGDLWVANGSANVIEFTPSQLSASGSPTPAVTLSSSAFTPADGRLALAFDASGDLWAANDFANTVFEFTPSQLTATGSPTPPVTLSVSAGSLDGPGGLAFDASGDLWVANFNTNAVVEFTPSQLTATGTPTPAVTLSANAGSIDFPGGLAFDASGDLWVANVATNTVVEFAPSQLSASGSPTPADTIGGASTGLNGPLGLAIAQAPTVTSVSPGSGPDAGGTVVTVRGSGFYPGTSVDFGPYWASAVTFVSAYELEATAPAGVGTADVTVTTFSGTSATSSADHFTYAAPSGYWEAAADGGVFAFGAPFHGSMGGQHLNQPVVGMASTPDGKGYWLVAKDGGIFSFGDAAFYGSMGGKALNAPVVGMAADPATGGYWEAAADGGVFSFGAPSYGSVQPASLTAPVVAMAATPDAKGYWLAASNGSIYPLGDATYSGSMSRQPLNTPVVGMAGD